MSKQHALRRFSTHGNEQSNLRDTLSALIQETHAQRKKGLPSPLASGPGRDEGQAFGLPGMRSPMLPDNLQMLLREDVPGRRIGDLVLPKEIRTDVNDFVHEARNIALLRAHSLEPRHTILLVGPPGTGKTSLASAIAHELDRPFLTVRYEGIVGSFLGETASRLQSVLEYAARTPCILFFDEFDSLGKERSDAQETGEIKRVVSTLLLHMDALPTSCIVICATNHPELLDRAVWRRFELRLEIPRPGEAELREWYMRTEKSFGDLGITAREFVSLFEGETFSEVEAVTLDARRTVVLSQGQLASADAFRKALDRWKRRRMVGGALDSGTRTVRKNSSRRSRADKDKGPEGALSESRIVGEPG